MQPASFKRHRFPPDVIRQAVWLYFRFTLSFRDVEEMLAQRGIDVSYETIRCWSLKVWSALRSKSPPIQAEANRAMAPGRNGREDRRQTDVASACRRR